MGSNEYAPQARFISSERIRGDIDELKKRIGALEAMLEELTDYLEVDIRKGSAYRVVEKGKK